MTGFVVPPLLKPDIEDLAMVYLIPFMTPTPVEARLPSPDATADTVNGFLRVEAGEATRWGLAAWTMSFLLHAYHPQEAFASDIMTEAMAYVTAAEGLSPMGWFVSSVVNVIGGRKLSDPDVSLPRYRGAVTWRVAGKPVGTLPTRLG